MWHSKAYHQFFEGYSERVVVDPATGKAKWERYYAGNYYCASLSPEQWRLRKLEYGGLYLLSALCLIGTSALRIDSNLSLLMRLPVLLSLIGLTVMIPSLFSVLTAKNALTEGEFREMKNFRSVCMGLVFVFGFSAAARVACMALHGQLSSGLEWLAVGGSVLDGAIMGWIYARERSLRYVRKMSAAQVPLDCYDITYREDETK